jgi:hypothetical protein
MMAYLHYPMTTGMISRSQPSRDQRPAARTDGAMPGWKSAYDLCPANTLTHYAK